MEGLAWWTATGDDQVLDLLVVEVAEVRLALTVAAVVQIHRMVMVSAVPNTPAVVEGVVNVHGVTVPVIDLRQRMGAAPGSLSPLTDHLVEVDAAGRRLALHVDHAVEVLSVPASRIDVAPPPEIDHAAGLVQFDDGLLMIYDLTAFLSDAEGLQLDAALTAAS